MELSVAVERELTQAIVGAIRVQVASLGEAKTVDLSDLEGAMVQAVRQVGSTCLEGLVRSVGTDYAGPTRPCACGAEQGTDHYATATWKALLGDVAIRRAAYHCPSCQAQAIPLDERVGLHGDRTSPLLRALLSRYCAAVPFVEACTLLDNVTGVKIAPNRAQVVSEAVGAKLAEQVATGEATEQQKGAIPRRLFLGMDGVLYCTTERDAERALNWREAKVAVPYVPLPPGVPKRGRRSHLIPDGPPLDVADPQSHS